MKLKFSHDRKRGNIKFDGIRTVGSKVALNVLLANSQADIRALSFQFLKLL